MSLDTGIIILVVLGVAAFIFWKKKNKATGSSDLPTKDEFPRNDGINQQEK
jgi:LPXTG-motif cell wall-anchored protein